MSQYTLMSLVALSIGLAGCQKGNFSGKSKNSGSSAPTSRYSGGSGYVADGNDGGGDSIVTPNDGGGHNTGGGDTIYTPGNDSHTNTHTDGTDTNTNTYIGGTNTNTHTDGTNTNTTTIIRNDGTNTNTHTNTNTNTNINTNTGGNNTTTHTETNTNTNNNTVTHIDNPPEQPPQYGTPIRPGSDDGRPGVLLAAQPELQGSEYGAPQNGQAEPYELVPVDNKPPKKQTPVTLTLPDSVIVGEAGELPPAARIKDQCTGTYKHTEVPAERDFLIVMDSSKSMLGGNGNIDDSELIQFANSLEKLTGPITEKANFRIGLLLGNAEGPHAGKLFVYGNEGAYLDTKNLKGNKSEQVATWLRNKLKAIATEKVTEVAKTTVNKRVVNKKVSVRKHHDRSDAEGEALTYSLYMFATNGGAQNFFRKSTAGAAPIILLFGDEDDVCFSYADGQRPLKAKSTQPDPKEIRFYNKVCKPLIDKTGKEIANLAFESLRPLVNEKKLVVNGVVYKTAPNTSVQEDDNSIGRGLLDFIQIAGTSPTDIMDLNEIQRPGRSGRGELSIGQMTERLGDFTRRRLSYDKGWSCNLTKLSFAEVERSSLRLTITPQNGAKVAFDSRSLSPEQPERLDGSKFIGVKIKDLAREKSLLDNPNTADGTYTISVESTQNAANARREKAIRNGKVVKP